ncbi:hypothetical protein Gpo141_00011541 [Globisporangium polare]
MGSSSGSCSRLVPSRRDKFLETSSHMSSATRHRLLNWKESLRSRLGTPRRSSMHWHGTGCRCPASGITIRTTMLNNTFGDDFALDYGEWSNESGGNSFVDEQQPQYASEKLQPPSQLSEYMLCRLAHHLEQQSVEQGRPRDDQLFLQSGLLKEHQQPVPYQPSTLHCYGVLSSPQAKSCVASDAPIFPWLAADSTSEQRACWSTCKSQFTLPQVQGQPS